MSSSTPANNNPFRSSQPNSGGSQRPSPFGSSTPKPAPSPAPSGSLLRRPPAPGSTSAQWAVRPLHEWAVRFDLNGLGDPFHRLLGTPLDPTYGDLSEVMQRLNHDKACRESLEQRLDDLWGSFGFQGAAMLNVWRDPVRQAFSVLRTLPAPTQKDDDSSDDSDDDSGDDDPPLLAATGKPPHVMRAIDLGLVLNVLARTRSVVLIGGTPLALEAGFLERVFLTDDPRLVALARATGFIEEAY